MSKKGDDDEDGFDILTNGERLRSKAISLIFAEAISCLPVVFCMFVSEIQYSTLSSPKSSTVDGGIFYHYSKLCRKGKQGSDFLPNTGENGQKQ